MDLTRHLPWWDGERWTCHCDWTGSVSDADAFLHYEIGRIGYYGISREAQ